MHNYVAVVMNDKKHAYAALHALWELDSEGMVTVHGTAVAHKNAWGQVEVDTKETHPALATAVGVGVGAILGFLAGPVGAVVGAVGGAAIGASIGGAVGLGTDLLRAEARDQADLETSLVMTPGQSVVIADVSEDSVWPIEARMRELGGVVHRRSCSALRHDREVDDFMHGSYRSLYPYEYVRSSSSARGSRPSGSASAWPGSSTGATRSWSSRPPQPGPRCRRPWTSSMPGLCRWCCSPERSWSRRRFGLTKAIASS